MELPSRATAAEIMYTISDLKTWDLRAASIDQIKSALDVILIGHHRFGMQIHAGQSVFRGRRGPKRLTIGELCYPPASETCLNRANRAGNPILYVSSIREIPTFELQLSVGDTVTLVEWVLSAPLFVNCVGYTEETFRRLGSARTPEHENSIQGPAHMGPVDEMVDVFLAESYTKPVTRAEEHEYRLTAAVAEWLFAADLFSGLMYPSIAMWANGDNLAIKPKAADEQLKFASAIFAEVVSVRERAIDLSVIDSASGLSPDGALAWRGGSSYWILRDQGDFLKLIVEDGRWVARDREGNLVEPS